MIIRLETEETTTYIDVIEFDVRIIDIDWNSDAENGDYQSCVNEKLRKYTDVNCESIYILGNPDGRQEVGFIDTTRADGKRKGYLVYGEADLYTKKDIYPTSLF